MFGIAPTMSKLKLVRPDGRKALLSLLYLNIEVWRLPSNHDQAKMLGRTQTTLNKGFQLKSGRCTGTKPCRIKDKCSLYENEIRFILCEY